MNKRYVDVDDVLNLFGISDRDIYAQGTIEDALYDGTLKVYKLPSAERRGRWVYDEWIGWCCSECGNQAPFWCISAAQNLTDYCPNCGAKME